MRKEDSAGARFGDIVQSYYQAWFRYHPEAAVDAGVAGYERLLTPYDAESMGALVCLNDELIVSLEELDREKLNADQEIDYRLLHGAALLENRRILDVDPRCPDPDRLLPVNAIYQLTIRPVANFEDALMARLHAIPDHMRDARDYLTPKVAKIPSVWLRSTVTAARQGAALVRGLPDHPKVKGMRHGLAGLEAAVDKAGQALMAYAEFLERDLSGKAGGDFACGQSYFEDLLHHRHFLDVSSEQLYELGQQLFDETRRDLKDACRQFAGNTDLAAAVRRINAKHPTAEKLLAVYRKQMQAARDFVREHDLVSLPATERLDVVETPVFLRHEIPFAAYNEPSPNDPEQHGYYYVTPPQDEEQLAEHNDAGLMHTCVHEAWPGHHLQFVTANLNPVARTLPRLLNPSATLYEGWALYSEQLMHEQGFLNRAEQRFILLRDRLWRVLRVLIDIDLHTHGLSFEKAADRLVTQLGFPRSQAVAEITWYSRSPTVPLGYATGWALINALRDRVRAENPGLNLKDFHDRLLSAGSIALPQVITRVFGKGMWSSVRSMLFGEVIDETA